MRYVYTVWLRDLALPEDDPDFEWPACFVIDGASQRSAQEWADNISQRYARVNNQRVLRSMAEAMETSSLPGLDGLPVVREGDDVTDEEIGW